MKIVKIDVKNVIGLKSADILLTRPVNFFCGANGAGKSSLYECVRHALLGESRRVPLKKDFGQLVHDGAEDGYVTIEWVGGEASIVFPAGVRTCEALDAAMPYVVDAQRFTAMPDSERRSFLFGLMKLSSSGDAVKARMLAKGCDTKKTEKILTTLRTGFENAAKEASGFARDAKAGWRITTGETYGEKKAVGWIAPKPEYDAGKLKLYQEEAVGIEAAIAAANTELGEKQGRAKAVAEQAGRMNHLRQVAGGKARAAEKLKVDLLELAAWEAQVAETRTKAEGAKPFPDPLVCPHCAALLDLAVDDNKADVLVPYEKSDAPLADPEAVEKLAEHERALALLVSSVANDRRDLATAEAAEKTLADLKEGFTQDAPTDGEMDRIKLKIGELKASHSGLLNNISVLAAVQRDAAAADLKTKQAGEYHAEVAGWDMIATALAPDGIPGEILKEALGPINARLAQSAIDAQWPKVVIPPDMTIIADGRMYALLNASQQWRVNAMIAEAVSFLSGIKMMFLDGADCLDMKGRNDFIAWLDVLAEQDEVETAMIFCTLKALPRLPGSMSSYWIEDGVVDVGAA